jgi:hypothetical protein
MLEFFFVYWSFPDPALLAFSWTREDNGTTGYILVISYDFSTDQDALIYPSPQAEGIENMFGT